MQYEVNTPQQYLDALENDWRKQSLQELRSLIKTKAPQFKEGINYKMLSYSDDNGVVFHLNAQKNYVSLYVGDSRKIDTEQGLLKDLDIGKGCIRFKKTDVISESRIDEFISRTVEMRSAGKDIDC